MGFDVFSNSIKGLDLAEEQMRRYKQIEYKAGASIEVVKCIPRKYRKGEGRTPGKKKTREEMQEANMRQAARKLARKINANFKPGDWHITLTYRTEPTTEKAQETISKFLDRMRDRYKRRGFQFKYILVTEYESKRIHHHIIINNVNDGMKTTSDFVRESWKGIGIPKFVPMYDNGEYRKLADYFVKETERTFRNPKSPVKQRYSCSRNLAEPQIRQRIKKTKSGWKMNPQPRPGYYIDPDTLYNGTDKLGYPYQRYIMVKLNPKEEDWEPCNEWQNEGGD